MFGGDKGDSREKKKTLGERKRKEKNHPLNFEFRNQFIA